MRIREFAASYARNLIQVETIVNSQGSRYLFGHSQNHLAVAGGYVVDALDFVNVSEMPAAHPPAIARWF